MGRRGTRLGTAVGIVLIGALGLMLAAEWASTAPAGAYGDEVFTDPSEDNPGGLAPDLTRVTVSSADNGTLRIRIETPNRTSLRPTDAVVMYMNTDLEGGTGSAGSDYRIEAFGGDPGVFLSHWSGSSWDRVSTSTFSGSFSDGIIASLRRADLGNTNGFTFFVVTYSNGRDPDWMPDDANNGARLAARLGSAPPTTTGATTTTPAKSTFTRFIERVRSGAIRIKVDSCAGRGEGSGILVGSRLVATVEHVVDHARTITFERAGRILGTGTVVGTDRSRDLALVRISKPVSGYQFRLARRTPNLGEAVAVLGYPLKLPLTVTRGTVSGQNRSVRIEGVPRRGLVQTDAAVNPGNSGGPLLSAETEEVVGLVDITEVEARGIAFAVSSRVAAPLVEAWAAAPRPQPAAKCR